MSNGHPTNHEHPQQAPAPAFALSLVRGAYISPERSLVMSDSFQHAVRMADAGFLVFPVHGVKHGQCTCNRKSCGQAGKHPRTREHKADDALTVSPYGCTTDFDQICDWWKKMPGSNYGIALTKFQVGLDPDSETAMQHLADIAGMTVNELLKCTYSARTPGGGYHLIWNTPIQIKGTKLKSFKTAAGDVIPDLDVKGFGGYLVGPGSSNAKGVYRVINDVKPTRIPDRIKAALLEAGCAADARPTPVQRPMPRPRSEPRDPTVPKGDMSEVDCDLMVALRRFPILGADRSCKMTSMVGSLLGSGRCPDHVRKVGKRWLAAQQDNFKTPLAEAYRLLDDNVDYTMDRIDSGQFKVSTEDDYIAKARAMPIDDAALDAVFTAKPGKMAASKRAFAVALVKSVLYKLLHSDDECIKLTNAQLMKLSGVGKSSLSRWKSEFITVVDNQGEVLNQAKFELVILHEEARGRRDASTGGAGLPTAYQLGADVVTYLMSAEAQTEPDPADFDPAEILASAEEWLAAQDDDINAQIEAQAETGFQIVEADAQTDTDWDAQERDFVVILIPALIPAVAQAG